MEAASIMAGARRAYVRLVFDGVDISRDVEKDIISLRYIDNEEYEADDLQIVLQDRDGRWLKKWLDDALIAQLNTEAKKTKGLAIKAEIICTDWSKPGDTLKLDCGEFALDEITADGPPARITIKASALPDRNGIKTTERSQSWENYKLSGIGGEIARRSGLGFIFDSRFDPMFDRKEQNEQTDISFLQKICSDAGYSLKISHGKVIIFDQAKYDNLQSVATITMGEGSYTRYNLRTGRRGADYTKCIVKYFDPRSGRVIEGEHKSEEYDEEKDNNRLLLVTNQQVKTNAEATRLAEKLLRLHNKFEKRVKITLPGNPSLFASEGIDLKDFGAFDGRYIITKSVHSVGGSGYKTDIELRKTL